jgi:hypothetical protein
MVGGSVGGLPARDEPLVGGLLLMKQLHSKLPCAPKPVVWKTSKEENKQNIK